MTHTDQQIPSDPDGRYVAGDKLTIELTVYDDAGDPKSLGNADVAFAVAEYSGAPPLIEKTTDSDVTVVDASEGRIDIAIFASDTAELGSPGGDEYYFEVAVRDGQGNEDTVTTGTWIIHANTATLP